MADPLEQCQFAYAFPFHRLASIWRHPTRE
jgi:hypothetical protein